MPNPYVRSNIILSICTGIKENKLKTLHHEISSRTNLTKVAPKIISLIFNKCDPSVKETFVHIRQIKFFSFNLQQNCTSRCACERSARSSTLQERLAPLNLAPRRFAYLKLMFLRSSFDRSDPSRFRPYNRQHNA